MKVSNSNVIEFYEKEAPEYDKRRWFTYAGMYFNTVQKEIILKMMDSWAGKNILDIGTGTGRFALALAKKGALVKAIDTSAIMLNEAKAKFTKDGIKGEFIQASAIHLPFQELFFDGCICINVLSHISAYQKVLREMSRVLKPGAFVIANFPNLLSYFLPYGLIVNKLKRSLRRNVYTHWYTLSKLKEAYHRAGFYIKDLRGQIHFPLANSIKQILPLFKYIDKASRKSILRYAAPILFIKGVKLK